MERPNCKQLTLWSRNWLWCRFERMVREGWPSAFRVLNSRQNSPQPIFQFDSAVGFLVTIFHDDWSVERETPFVRCALFHCALSCCARAYCARAYLARPRHHYGIFGNFERSVESCTVDFAAHKVVKRRGPSQDRPRTEDGAGAHQRAFVDSAIAAHQHVILDNHRRGVHRFKHATDWASCAKMHA